MGSVWPARHVKFALCTNNVEETSWPARRQHWVIIQPAPFFNLLLLLKQLKLICARTSTERPKTEQNIMTEVIII